VTPGAGTDRARAENAAPTRPTRDSSATYEQLFTAATFADEVPEDPGARRRPRRTRRRLIAPLVALALVLAAVGTGWAWSSHAAKQPALKALRAGNDIFESMATDLRVATELEAFRDSARQARAAADRVDRAGRPITPAGSELERRVLDVLRAEATILRAAAEVADLEIGSLGDWPRLNGRLADAEKALRKDVRRLSTADADAARPVRTGFALAAHTTEVVGDFAAATVTARLDGHLDDLTAARTTRDVRTAAARTGRSAAVVASAVEGLDAASPQGEQVNGVGETLAVLGKLRRLDGDHLAVWTTVRGQLLAATGELVDVDAGPAVDTLDDLVTGAAQELRRWRKDTARATARAKRDSARLTRHVEATLAALQDFDTTGRGVADFSGRAQQGERGGVTYQAADSFLDRAEQDLRSVRTDLADAAPVRRLRAQHRALLDGLDRTLEAVRGGHAGIGRPAGCLTKAQKRAQAAKPGPTPTPVCHYLGSEGWTSFRDGWAGATQDLLAARTAWDGRVKEARAAIEDRELPRKPKV
jgi:hypothetical protein